VLEGKRGIVQHFGESETGNAVGFSIISQYPRAK
jgi:hypothetical protein